MRMIKKAAEVLNDADDFERKLAVILFQQEVAYIWDDTHEWKPGDPIFERPNRWFDTGQQYIRPMIEEFEDGDATSGRQVRCTECDTYWRGDEPCFSCGEIIPAPTFDESLITQAGWRSTSLFGEDFDGEFDVVEWVRTEMQTLVFEEVSRSLFQAIIGDMPEIQVNRGGIRFPGLDIIGEQFNLPPDVYLEWVNEPIRMLVVQRRQRHFNDQMAIYNAISDREDRWGDLLVPYAVRDVGLTTELWQRANPPISAGRAVITPRQNGLGGLRPSFVIYDEAPSWTENRVNGVVIPYYADYREVEFVPTPPEITPQIARHMSTIATNSAYGTTPVTERRRDYRGSRG